MGRIRGIVVVSMASLLVTLGVAVPGTTPVASAASPCDHWASPAGDDADPGTKSRPVRHPRRLLLLLRPGQTGCLRGGTYGEALGEMILVDAIAKGKARRIIRSAPGEQARIVGQMEIQSSVTDVTFRRLRFDGLPGVPKAAAIIVNGSAVWFDRVRVSNPQGFCFDVGDVDAYQGPGPTRRVQGFRLTRSRIHDCGSALDAAEDWGSGESGVHAIYLVNTADAIIRDSLIYDAVNRGIQLWPNADDTLIEHNVLDGNGSNVNIGACWEPWCTDGLASTGTLVRRNIISFAPLRSLDPPFPDFPPGDLAQVYGNFAPGSRSTDFGNRVRDNCVHQPDPALNFGGNGYAGRNSAQRSTADPRYRDREAGDFSLRRSSPCLGLGPR